MVEQRDGQRGLQARRPSQVDPLALSVEAAIAMFVLFDRLGDFRQGFEAGATSSSTASAIARSVSTFKQFRSSQISRLLKRLCSMTTIRPSSRSSAVARLHGIIKKIGRTYKYYLTELGRHTAIAGLTLKNLFLVPEFASAALAY
jgi:hypothetical protein